MTPGEYIKLRREARGLSQLDVTAAIEGDQPHLSRIERDLVRPRAEMCGKLADAIGFPVEVLVDLMNGYQPQICRQCGCTAMDACVPEDGEPCHWVENDLCSVCERKS